MSEREGENATAREVGRRGRQEADRLRATTASESESERAEGERREKKENEERERERTSSAPPLPLALFSLAARPCYRGRAQTRCFRSEGDRKEWKGEAASERDRQAERRGRGLAERDEQSEGAFEGGTKKITTKSPRPKLTLRGRLLRRRLLRGGGLLHGGLLDGGLLGLGTGEGGRKRKRKDGQHLILLERKKEKRRARWISFENAARAPSRSRRFILTPPLADCRSMAIEPSGRKRGQVEAGRAYAIRSTGRPEAQTPQRLQTSGGAFCVC